MDHIAKAEEYLARVDDIMKDSKYAPTLALSAIAHCSLERTKLLRDAAVYVGDGDEAAVLDNGSAILFIK